MSGLRLLAPVALRAPIGHLVERFEALQTLKVAVDFDLNPAILDRMIAGDTPDVVLTRPPLMEELIEAGLVSGDLHRPFGRISLALGRACVMTDPLRTIPEVRAFLCEAGSIGYTHAATSGRLFMAALEDLGIADDLAPRLRPMEPGEPARAAAAGKIDLAAAPLPVILATEGLNPVAIMPGTLGTDQRISVSLSVPGMARDAAHDLLNHLSGKDSDPALKEHGVARFKFD